MAEDKFIFGYIKNYYSKAIEYLKQNSIICLYGEPRIGKTYLAQMCMGSFPDTLYYKLHLKAYNGYNPSYYAFHLGLLELDALYETAKEVVADAKNIQGLPAIAKVIEYYSSYKQKCLYYLNESEISIINRINIHCKNRPLFLIVDNYEKWDDASKNLLNFFMTPSAQNTISFLANCKIIIVADRKETVDKIKDQLGDVKCINIKGYESIDPFVDEFLRIKFSSDRLAQTLYQITNGNMGMALDLSFYMGGKNLNNNIPSPLQEFQAKKIFLSLIEERVHNINEDNPQFSTTIKAASIQGMVFDQKYLPEIMEQNEFAIERMLSLAMQKHFLVLTQDKQAIYSFINEYIYQYFDEHYNEYRKEYHYKFACAVKKVHPSDYYTQYLHLRAAEKTFESAENLVIHLTYLKLKNDFIDNILLDYLKDVSEDLYNSFLIISQSIDAFHNGLHKKALAKLEFIEPISEIIFLEKDYLVAYFIYDGWVYERNTEACDILVNNFDNLLNTNFDVWLRSGLLLYIFYVNRLHDEQQAKAVEKTIMKEISKRYRHDASLQMIVHILNRNASALYSVEIALGKNKKSVEYFADCAHTLPQEYIYALTNYSGLLLVASEYEEGFLHAQKAIEYILENKVWINDLGKVINNYLVNGVMCQKIDYTEAIKISMLYMQNSSSHKNILLKNNYFIFRIMAGEHEGLMQEIDELFWSDSVQKHNDYYVYLIGINYIFISIIMNDYSSARKIYDVLDGIIPAICSNEEYIIKKRYEVFENIITDSEMLFSDLESLEKYFNKGLIDIISDYAKRPYILTDQQFWSVI